MIFSIDHADRSARAALVDGPTGNRWTYGRLAEEVAKRKRMLPAERKRLVFHFCRNHSENVVWYLALLEAGHAQALLNAALDAGLRDRLMDAFRPDYVILPERPSAAYETGGVDGLWRLRSFADDQIHPNLALLLSTSGSTGSPKLARLTRGNLESNAASIGEGLGITPEQRPLAHLPLYYSYGLSVFNSHFAAGATVVMTGESLVTQDFWDTARREKATSFSGVPYTYQMLRRLDLNRLNVPSLQDLTQAGGKLDTPAIDHFHRLMDARGGRFWVMYGQTEATARIAILPARDLPRKLGSVGRPIAGGKFEVVRPGHSAPAGDGELVYSGPNVMMGYAFSRECLAKGDEMQGRLFTGDQVRVDEEGYLYVVGRGKRDAKVFGLRINLDDVETLVKTHGPAAVVGGNDRLVFFCEFGDEAEFARLQGDLSAKLRLHHSAFEFHRVDKLPTNASGKIDYQELGRR